MSIEAWTQTPVYTVSGIGPYEITHPYAADAILVFVVVSGVRVPLNTAEFTLSPSKSTTRGNLFLTPAVAATHAGKSLIIDRQTPDEQGWLGVRGEREAGLEAQLDRMVQATQEIRSGLVGSVRTREPLDAFDWLDGTVPVRSGNSVISGPSAIEIIGAQGFAETAVAAAAAAAASAAEAEAKQNSMLRDRGPYLTGTAYAPSDSFDFDGQVYITNTAHFATSIAADLSAGRIRLWVRKGAAGAGTGDMLNSENLSGLTNKPLAYVTLGGKAVGKVDLLPFSLIDPSAIISDVQGLANNKVPNAFGTVKAVTDYVDEKLLSTAPIASFEVTAPVTSILLNGLDGWDEVEICGELTGTGAIVVRASPDNGTTIRISNYDGRIADHVDIDNYPSGFKVVRSNNAGPQNFTMRLREMASATRKTSAYGEAFYLGGSRINTHGTVLNTLEICNALQVLGGTISAGWVEVRGIRKAFVEPPPGDLIFFDASVLQMNGADLIFTPA